MPINIRVPLPLLEQVKAAAANRGVPYQRLIKVWLEDAVANDLQQGHEESVRLRLTRDQLTRLRQSGLDIHVESL